MVDLSKGYPKDLTDKEEVKEYLINISNDIKDQYTIQSISIKYDEVYRQLALRFYDDLNDFEFCIIPKEYEKVNKDMKDCFLSYHRQRHHDNYEGHAFGGKFESVEKELERNLKKKEAIQVRLF